MEATPHPLPGKDGVYRRYAVLAWGLALVSAEVAGIAASYLAYARGFSPLLCGSVGDAVIVSTRFLALAYVVGACGLDLPDVIYRPLPSRRGLATLTAAILCVALLDFIVALSAYGRYSPQLLDIGRFLSEGALWAFPLKVAYYFSEVTAMNAMYLLASKGWALRRGHLTSGTLFLILGWALPHALTKNVVVALYAAVLVLVFYAAYEDAGSPLVPVILWFTVLLV